MALRNPESGQLTTDPVSQCRNMSNALLSMGGPLHFLPPPSEAFSSLIALSPICLSSLPLPPMDVDWFQQKLGQSKPDRAGVFDGTNLYLWSLAPPPIRTWLFQVCNLCLHKPMPPEWSTAIIHLLYKKGDPSSPVNYRPISLLNSIYKVVASHLCLYISQICAQHTLLHPCQYGGRRNFRTADHIYEIQARRQLYGPAYHLYIDLNKAFNSIPHQALWDLLHYMGFHPTLITAIQNLYQHPLDMPRVNGHTLHTHSQTRGLRQGCPLSPILFNIYLNPLLFQVSGCLNPYPEASLHAFIDDILIRSPCPHIIRSAFKRFIQGAEILGLSINFDKTELHALDGSPHLSLSFSPFPPLSAYIPGTLPPRTSYKYLGVWFFNSSQATALVDYIQREITSYFHNLSVLPLSPGEIILLVNRQLIPILLYRMLAHPLNTPQLDIIQKMIWTKLAKACHIPLSTSPKDTFHAKSKGGLGLKCFRLSLACQDFNYFSRFWLSQGPPSANQQVKSVMGAQTASP